MWLKNLFSKNKDAENPSAAPKKTIKAKPYEHYRSIAEFPDEIVHKKRKPKVMAIIDEDNCTGCQVCIPFCPVDCIESVPHEKYNIVIPPVQVRYNECIGCSICARECTKLTWDAIRMVPLEEFEERFPEVEITNTFIPEVQEAAD